MKKQKTKLDQQVSTKLGTIVLIIIAITVGVFVWKIGKNQEVADQSQGISPKQIENNGYTGELATYTNCKNGYSFKYPKESKVIETLNGDNFISDTSVSITAYDDLHSVSDFLNKYPAYKTPDEIGNQHKINNLTVAQLKNTRYRGMETRYLLVKDKVFYLEAQDKDAAVLNTVIQNFSTTEDKSCQYDLAIPTDWSKFKSTDNVFTLKYPNKILRYEIDKSAVTAIASSDHAIYTYFKPQDYKQGIEFPNYKIEISVGDIVPMINSSYKDNPGLPLNTSGLESPTYFKDVVFKGYPCKIGQQLFNGGWREVYFFNLGKKYVRISGFIKNDSLNAFYGTYSKILNSFEFNKDN